MYCKTISDRQWRTSDNIFGSALGLAPYDTYSRRNVPSHSMIRNGFTRKEQQRQRSTRLWNAGEFASVSRADTSIAFEKRNKPCRNVVTDGAGGVPVRILLHPAVSQNSPMYHNVRRIAL